MKRKSNLKLLILFLHITFANTMLAQINTNLPVGAIPGAIDVSPMGAATYTIPIEVVPGTQGMQPNLSIVYNSMGGMGLLGMKWNLAGLSAISRCGQTPYYDNDVVTSIQFLNNGAYTDRFAIDGERLVSLNGTYGAVGGEYATEMENFMRVFSYGGTTNHPAHFKAFTDDGSIIEYGNTSNSQHKMGTTDKVLSWYVNKITDVNGNYMTFNYKKYGNEMVIDYISYTGNNFSPYAKVEFSYRELPAQLGKNTYFVGGFGIPQTKLLEFITIKYNNIVVRKYHFKYNTDITEEFTAHLKEIVLSAYDENGIEIFLNPTTIVWGEKDDNATLNDSGGLPFHKKWLTGDFNGDGYTDILYFNTGNNENKWELYLHSTNTDHTFNFHKSGTHQKTNCQFHVARNEFKDELYIIEKYGNTNMWYVKNISFNPYKETSYTTPVYNFVDAYFGRFENRDNAQILFLCSSDKKNYDLVDITGFSFFNFSLGKKDDPFNLYITDLDGTGTDNLQLVMKEIPGIDDFTAFTYDYNGGLHLVDTDGFPTIWHHVYYGDFNGDGIKDALVYTNDNKWLLHIGKGNFKFTHPGQNVTKLNSTPKDITDDRSAPKFPALIADFNGDGKDEIAQVVSEFIKGGQHPPTPGRWRSTVDILYLKEISEDESWVFWNCGKYCCEADRTEDLYNLGDFNNDGRMDVIWEKSIICIEGNKQYEFVQEIRNGMGQKNKLTYNPKFFKAEYIYYENSSTSRSYYKKYFFPVIQSVQMNNETESSYNTKLNYLFEEPAFSLNRKTFLGFRSVTCTNTQLQKTDKSLFKFDDIFCPDTYGILYGNREILLPVKQTNSVNSVTVSNKIFSSQIKMASNYPNPNRFISCLDMVTATDEMSDIKTVTTTTLNTAGRVGIVNTKTFNACNSTTWLHSETQNYTYQTITLNGNQKKTVPTQVLTTQQYGSNGTIIADTVTYEYYPPSLKCFLMSMQRRNLDGSIKTSYSYNIATGVCIAKTVSAAGCTSRKEQYEYDATYRFVTKITNPLKHSANYTYDAKTGNKLTETSANGLTTTYIYDSFGRLKQVNHPDGTVTKDTIYWYSGSIPSNAKYCTKTTTTSQPDLIVYYDILGREVCRFDDGNYFDTRYNNKGQVTQTSYPYTKLSDPDNSKDWNKFDYDNFGRKSKEIAPYCSLSYSYDKRKVTITDHLRNNQTTWKDYDALGRITKAQDPGGLINYTYNVNSNKRHITTIETNGATTTIETDLWGNRLKLTEPNAGTITSEYTKFNELKKQTDANGNITMYTYDLIGRVTTENFTSDPNHMPYPPSVVYTYDTGNKALGKLSKIEMAGYVSEQFTYDNFGRVATHTKHTGVPSTFHYTYNANGQLERLKYPGGNFAVDYNYTTDGKLKEIRRSGDNSLIYKVNTRNKYQQPINDAYGNSRIMPISTQYNYNDFGMITGIKTTVGMQSDTIDPWGGTGGTFEDRGNGIVMNYVYGYNEKGLMTSRTDNTVNQNESYVYDNLDRLTKNTYYDYKGKKVVQTFTYQPNGNILSNSQVGEYIYDPVKKHAVTQIECPNPDLISQNKCSVVYNRFNQPTKVTETSTALSHQIELSYGANRQRNKAVFKENDSIIDTRHYINKYYERGRDSLGKTLYYHYIYGDGGVVALHIGNRNINLEDSTALFDPGGIDQPNDRSVDTVDVMYFIHTDHLGSYCALTDIKGNVVQRNCFDPWGNYAFDKWYICSITHPRGDTLSALSFPITRRGFTGHEHYPELKIINMNGRLYDPVIARFFSPDKYVANSSFTQDFNRYTYARNNPLMYTDPSGEFIWIPVVLGAVFGIVQGAMIGHANGAQGGEWAGYILGGAAIGALSGLAGGAVAGAIGQAAFLGSGIVGASVGGAVSGAISGFGYSTMAAKGDVVAGLNGMWKGAVSGLAGGLVGSSIGGGIGAFAGGATSGVIGSALNGGKGGDILKAALIGGAVSYGSFEIQQAISYGLYKGGDRLFGDLKYSGFRKISVATQRSFAWGKEAGGWILNDGTVGKIAYGDGGSVTLPPRPGNAASNFHTHPNQPNIAMQWHGRGDLTGETDVNYVIGWNTTYRHNPNTHPYLPNPSWSVNYIRHTYIPSLLTPSNNGFNSYPFYWFYFGH